MTPRGPIPVTVVTGFLGAGKSTLVAQWLTELGDETAVIVNEWGTVAIDGELIGAAGQSLIEITGGCLCCTSQVEMARALRTLAEQQPGPSRVLVETSGAASPAGVLRALNHSSASERLRLDGVVTVVDGTRPDVLKRTLAVEQLGFSDMAIVSHADELSPDGSVISNIRNRAPAAAISLAARGVVHDENGAPLSFQQLLAQRQDALHLPDLPATTSHEAIDSIALREGELEEERFLDWMSEGLAAVEARILRIKGILAIAGVDTRVIVQGVGQAIEVTMGRPWGDELRQSRLVILGLGLDASPLEQGFAACASPPGRM